MKLNQTVSPDQGINSKTLRRLIAQYFTPCLTKVNFTIGVMYTLCQKEHQPLQLAH